MIVFLVSYVLIASLFRTKTITNQDNKGLSIYYVIWNREGGVFPIYYNITMGGEGSLGTPNLYYVIYGQPLYIFIIPTSYMFIMSTIFNVFVL